MKKKLLYLHNAFEKFVDAHRDYVGEIMDENAINEGQRYLENKERKVGVSCQQVVIWIFSTKHKRLAESLQVDLVVNLARRFLLVLPRFLNIQIKQVRVVAILHQLQLREQFKPQELPS